MSTPDHRTWGISKDGRTLNRGLSYPQTLFVTMSNDTWGVGQAPVDVAFLRANGVRSAYIAAPSRQVTPSWFSERAPLIDVESSAIIVAALQEIGLVGADGWLVDDPKRFDVRAGVEGVQACSSSVAGQQQQSSSAACLLNRSCPPGLPLRRTCAPATPPPGTGCAS